MSYQALYRVWRPQRFEDIVGQEHVTGTLMNALAEGHLSHAYLFTGPRGTGKTSAAKILSKAVNCIHGPRSEPCNECEACRRITEGSMMDVIEIDAASNRGVDEIRDLRDNVKYAPTEVKYKVYIIDEVHMLTTEAFNALLKTLEEPPRHVLFILATTEPYKLPATIVSRCQRFNFRRIPYEKIMGRLQEVCQSQKVSFTESALLAIARAADGGMRDALSLLDQSLAFAGDVLDEETVLHVTGSISYEALYALLQAVIQQQSKSALEQLNDLIEQGYEAERILQDLTYAFRDLLLLKTAPKLGQSQGLSVQEWVDQDVIQNCSTAKLSEILDQLIYFQQQMKFVAHHRILLEVALVQLCEPPEVVKEATASAELVSAHIKKLEERIARLEKQLQRQAPTSGPSKADAFSSLDQQKEESKPGASLTTSPLFKTNWVQQASLEQLRRVRSAWQEIMHQVKRERVTLHAWLIDCEPVLATKDVILVAFRTPIHRRTVERPESKVLIEKVIHRVLGSPYQLQTVMVAEWKKLKASIQEQRGTKEEAVTVEKKTDNSDQGNDIVKRAVALFGTDLVEISSD